MSDIVADGGKPDMLKRLKETVEKGYLKPTDGFRLIDLNVLEWAIAEIERGHERVEALLSETARLRTKVSASERLAWAVQDYDAEHWDEEDREGKAKPVVKAYDAYVKAGGS